jgi:hypothetical protein
MHNISQHFKERKMKKQSWRPDWKKKSAYPHHKKTTVEQWAWEFLRRNPEYQDDYQKFKKNPEDFPSTNFFHSIPRELDKDFASTDLAYKWGILEMIDPSLPDASNVTFREGSFVIYNHGWTDDPNEILPENWDMEIEGRLGEVCAMFDLTRQIDLQIRMAENQLRALQGEFQKRFKTKAKDVRAKKESYSDYLRVLDGKEAGAARKEMADIICPLNKTIPSYKRASAIESNRQKITKHLEAAKELMKSGYRYLPLCNQKLKSKTKVKKKSHKK